MNFALLLSISGLALADSLNPFTVAAQAYLLGTPNPMKRSVTFLVGTFVAYFLGGVLLLAGLRIFLERVMPLVPVWGFGAGEIVLGGVLGFCAFYAGRMAKQGKPFSPPKDLSVGATLIFAMASTVSDIPTAIPYFAAASNIAAQDAGWISNLCYLLIYNVLFCAPLIALIVARFLLSEEKSGIVFGKMRAGIDWGFAKLLPIVLAVGALALLVDGARRLMAL